MRLGVTSIVRTAVLDEPSGFLRVVDLEEKRVSATFTLPESVHRARDPNPRGGERGAKGLAVDGDRLVVANVQRLFFLDTSWRIAADFSHPWLGGIHDLLGEPDGIWVTCTDADLLAKASWQGGIVEAWSWRSDAQLAEQLGLRGVPEFDPSMDYRDPLTTHTRVGTVVHLNAVTRADGGLLLSFGRILPRRRRLLQEAKGDAAAALVRTGIGRRAVATVVRKRARRIEAQSDFPVERIEACSSALVQLAGINGDRRAELLARVPAPAGVPNHNALRIGEWLVYNDSNNGCVSAYDPVSGRLRTVPLPGAHRFPRGLLAVDGGATVLVGSQHPAALHALDLDGGRVEWSLTISPDPREAVYAIAPIPDRFDDPSEPSLRLE